MKEYIFHWKYLDTNEVLGGVHCLEMFTETYLIVSPLGTPCTPRSTFTYFQNKTSSQATVIVVGEMYGEK